MTTNLTLKVAIASTGRRAALSLTLRELCRQKRLPNEVIICPAAAEDCDEAVLKELSLSCRVVRGPRGLSAQRNLILRECGSCDVLVFLDDDFYPSADYLANVEHLFASQTDIVGATGQVLADGAITAGIAHEEAVSRLASHRSPSGAGASPLDVYALYGCNMALRMTEVYRHQLRFDERLPLYGWLEDVDFSRQLAQYGRLVRAPMLAGVHLAVKKGRSNGVPLGYSQIANPWYLLWKGTISPTLALRQISRNVAANAYRMLSPEPWVDRRGRLRGNALAALHLLIGRIDPAYILKLSRAAAEQQTPLYSESR